MGTVGVTEQQEDRVGDARRESQKGIFIYYTKTIKSQHAGRTPVWLT